MGLVAVDELANEFEEVGDAARDQTARAGVVELLSPPGLAGLRDARRIEAAREALNGA